MKIGIYISEIWEEVSQFLYHIFCKNKIKVQAEKNYEIFKWHSYSNLMFQWMRVKQKNRNLTEYLTGYGCKKVAVYGLGEAGKLCCDEILQSGKMEIPYIVDRVYHGEYKDIPVISPDSVNNEVDAIIVTPVHCYLEIADTLYQHTTAKLISLEDMVTVLNGYEGQKYYG